MAENLSKASPGEQRLLGMEGLGPESPSPESPGAESPSPESPGAERLSQERLGQESLGRESLGAESFSQVRGLAPAPEPASPDRAPARVPGHVARNLVSGTSAMGAGALIERGLGFLANILAARFGGASTFGAYSLGITTAANISTYAAGGIGSTAARFSGKYPLGTPGYPSLARALAIVSVVSATVAAAALWFGAVPLAHILEKESLAPLLRWAAFSAAGLILLECARGFFVGQRRLAALLLLSLVAGLGMVVLIPLAARHHNPAHMILSQAAITVSAVGVCLLLARPLGMLARSPAAGNTAVGSAGSVGPVLREVWSFGMVQLAGLVGMNLAGWWLTTLVARADTTLVQMSFFAIANQMRNIVGLGPSLLTESSYAIMAASHGPRRDGNEGEAQGPAAGPDREPNGGLGPDRELGPNRELGPEREPDLHPGEALLRSRDQDPAPYRERRDQTPDDVMALCTYFATGSSLLLSAVGIVIVPWALTLLYGSAYRAGAITTAVALAIAIVHMGNSPAAARLTIVSIKTSGLINTLWAICVAGAGTALLLHGGTAWQAMAVYLGAHLLSSSLVLAALLRHRCVPPGMVSVLALGALTSVALAGLAYLRNVDPGLAVAATLAMLALIAAALTGLAMTGKRHGWLPTVAAVRHFLLAPLSRLLTAGRRADAL